MKQLIKKAAHRFGYQICRLSIEADEPTDPFDEMSRLCADIDEPIIFDVGAHHGETAKIFRQALPNSQIFSFEPFPESFDELQRYVANDRRTTALNFGLSDQEGVLDFHSNRSSATNSLLPTDSLGPKTWGTGLLETKEIVQAQFKTLDAVIGEIQVPRIDILKLDVQGAEHLVLEGADLACKEGRINIVYSEIITQPTYVGQKRLDEALAVFYDRGFELHNLYNFGFTSEGRVRQCDAIFIRKSQV